MSRQPPKGWKPDWYDNDPRQCVLNIIDSFKDKKTSLFWIYLMENMSEISFEYKVTEQDENNLFVAIDKEQWNVVKKILLSLSPRKPKKQI